MLHGKKVSFSLASLVVLWRLAPGFFQPPTSEPLNQRLCKPNANDLKNVTLDLEPNPWDLTMQPWNLTLEHKTLPCNHGDLTLKRHNLTWPKTTPFL